MIIIIIIWDAISVTAVMGKLNDVHMKRFSITDIFRVPIDVIHHKLTSN